MLWLLAVGGDNAPLQRMHGSVQQMPQATTAAGSGSAACAPATPTARGDTQNTSTAISTGCPTENAGAAAAQHLQPGLTAAGPPQAVAATAEAGKCNAAPHAASAAEGPKGAEKGGCSTCVAQKQQVPGTAHASGCAPGQGLPSNRARGAFTPAHTLPRATAGQLTVAFDHGSPAGQQHAATSPSLARSAQAVFKLAAGAGTAMKPGNEHNKLVYKQQAVTVADPGHSNSHQHQHQQQQPRHAATAGTVQSVAGIMQQMLPPQCVPAGYHSMRPPPPRPPPWPPGSAGCQPQSNPILAPILQPGQYYCDHYRPPPTYAYMPAGAMQQQLQHAGHPAAIRPPLGAPGPAVRNLPLVLQPIYHERPVGPALAAAMARQDAAAAQAVQHNQAVLPGYSGPGQPEYDSLFYAAAQQDEGGGGSAGEVHGMAAQAVR